MKTVALLSLLAGPFVVGCTFGSSNTSNSSSYSASQEPLHSATIATGELKPSLSAQSSDTTIKIYAALFANPNGGGNVGVVLDQGDFFTAKVGSSDATVLTMEPLEDGTTVHYTATIPAATTAEDIVIALVRGGGQVSAPYSVIHVPAPFAFVSTPPVSIKYGAALAVQVAPASSDTIKFEATGSCVATTGNDSLTAPVLDDSGKGVIDTSQIKLVDGSPGCDISFYLSFSEYGSIDSAFASDFTIVDIEGLQKRGMDTAVTR